MDVQRGAKTDEQTRIEVDFIQNILQLDTHITETLLSKLLQERGWKRVGSALVLEERHYDHVCSRTDTKWTLVQDGKMFEKSTSIRLYTYRELCQLLEQLGFASFKGYGSLSEEPFQLGSPRLYLVATKC